MNTVSNWIEKVRKNNKNTLTIDRIDELEQRIEFLEERHSEIMKLFAEQDSMIVGLKSFLKI